MQAMALEASLVVSASGMVKEGSLDTLSLNHKVIRQSCHTYTKKEVIL